MKTTSKIKTIIYWTYFGCSLIIVSLFIIGYKRFSYSLGVIRFDELSSDFSKQARQMENTGEFIANVYYYLIYIIGIVGVLGFLDGLSFYQFGKKLGGKTDAVNVILLSLLSIPIIIFLLFLMVVFRGFG